MKAMIVGAGGQLGRALLASAPVEIEVIGLDRAALDISDDEAVAAAIARLQPEIIINAAAYTAVDKAESEREAAYGINADGPRQLADAAERRGARFIHVSTDFVFDGKASRPYRPEDKTEPLSVYGASKLTGETAALGIYPDTLVVRTAWVYAAGGRNFMETMLRLIAERDEVRVVADQIGTPTHAISLARALWAMAKTDARGIVHWTDAGIASWYDFAVAIAEEAGAMGLIANPARITPIATADYPTPAVRPSYGVLDKTSGWALSHGAAQHWRVELRAALRARSEV